MLNFWASTASSSPADYSMVLQIQVSFLLYPVDEDGNPQGRAVNPLAARVFGYQALLFAIIRGFAAYDVRNAGCVSELFTRRDVQSDVGAQALCAS